jgi:hypothetical protein
MNQPGASNSDILVAARSALLDALEALNRQRQAVIVIGAQAVYFHTGQLAVALPETTKDSDLAIDPRILDDEPLLEQAMREAGFLPDETGQPGAWVTPQGIPVDLMVPEAVAGAGSATTRGARIPPHSRRATRRARGLEAVLIDNSIMNISALDPADTRVCLAHIAGPAALLVAKLHKIGDRQETPHRLNNKDAHDAYRLLASTPTTQLASVLTESLLPDPIAGDATRIALGYLRSLFANGPDALGSAMAGHAEEGFGDVDTVALSVSVLAQNLLGAIGR